MKLEVAIVNLWIHCYFIFHCGEMSRINAVPKVVQWIVNYICVEVDERHWNFFSNINTVCGFAKTWREYHFFPSRLQQLTRIHFLMHEQNLKIKNLEKIGETIINIWNENIYVYISCNNNRLYSVLFLLYLETILVFFICWMKFRLRLHIILNKLRRNFISIISFLEIQCDADIYNEWIHLLNHLICIILIFDYPNWV